jgi:hypothetical protein
MCESSVNKFVYVIIECAGVLRLLMVKDNDGDAIVACVSGTFVIGVVNLMN